MTHILSEVDMHMFFVCPQWHIWDMIEAFPQPHIHLFLQEMLALNGISAITIFFQQSAIAIFVSGTRFCKGILLRNCLSAPPQSIAKMWTKNVLTSVPGIENPYH